MKLVRGCWLLSLREDRSCERVNMGLFTECIVTSTPVYGTVSWRVSSYESIV
jgi:hypothetical protein